MRSIRDTEILYEGASRLLLGVFGHGNGEDGPNVVRYSGTGIVVAPCHALTAAHVLQDAHRVDPTTADDFVKWEGPGYRKPSHWLSAFQVLDTGRTQARLAMWGITRTWRSRLTDLALMELAPDGEEAARLLFDPIRFPTWALLPPPEGAQVEMIGFPSSSVRIEGEGMRFSGPYVLQSATVARIYKIRRDLGIYSFPGFVVDQTIEPGFSGGPVFWEGKLCGLVSGDSLEGTYVASLWPLCLTVNELPGMGELNQRFGVADLIDKGILKSSDWPMIKDRIAVREEDGRHSAHIDDAPLQR